MNLKMRCQKETNWTSTSVLLDLSLFWSQTNQDLDIFKSESLILWIMTNDSTLKFSVLSIMMKTSEIQRLIRKFILRMSLIPLIKKWKLYKDTQSSWSLKMIFECGSLIMICISTNSQSFKKSFKNFWRNTQAESTRQLKSQDNMWKSKTAMNIIWGLNSQVLTFIICLMSWSRISCKRKSSIDLSLLSWETNLIDSH